MTKTEFLKQLFDYLSPLSINDKERTISYYQELIDDQLENGKNEQEIIESLENPIIIANKIKNELSQKEEIATQNDNVNKKSKVGIILAIILGFPIWFSLLASLFAVIIAIFVSIYSVLISLFASVFAVGVYGIVQTLACWFYLGINPIYAISILGMGLVAMGFSILLAFASVYLAKITLKFTKWFFIKTKKRTVSMLGGKQ